MGALASSGGNIYRIRKLAPGLPRSTMHTVKMEQMFKVITIRSKVKKGVG